MLTSQWMQRAQETSLSFSPCPSAEIAFYNLALPKLQGLFPYNIVCQQLERDTPLCHLGRIMIFGPLYKQKIKIRDDGNRPVSRRAVAMLSHQHYLHWYLGHDELSSGLRVIRKSRCFKSYCCSQTWVGFFFLMISIS